MDVFRCERRSLNSRVRLAVCEKVSPSACVSMIECVGVSSHECALEVCPGGEANPQAGGARANRINTH